MLHTPITVPRVGSRAAEWVSIQVMIVARTGQNRSRAEVLDCSATGLSLRTINPLRLGQSFWVKFPGLEAKEIEVMWVDGSQAGCKFRQPFDERVFKCLLQGFKGGQAPAFSDRRATLRPV